jgi:hypothetical protein
LQQKIILWHVAAPYLPLRRKRFEALEFASDWRAVYRRSFRLAEHWTFRPSVYWVVASVALFIAFFRAWNDEASAREQALAQLANLEKGVKAAAYASDVSAATWKSLGKEFRELPRRIRADWHRDGDGTESWILLYPACKGLCTLAGAMLSKSPKVFAMLPQKVRSEGDAMSRWLSFLKERQPIRIQDCYETMPDGRQKIILFGSIEDVSENSSTACIECAAAET